MGISFLPKSLQGKWSGWLGIAWILFFALSEVLTGFEVLGPEANMALAVVLTIVDTAIAAGALVTGLISIIKSKERSILVFLTTAIGLYGLTGSAMLGLAN